MKATKNKEILWSMRVTEDIDNEITKIADKNKMTKTALIEKLILRFLARIDWYVEDNIIDVYCKDLIKYKESESDADITEVK